MHRSSRVQGVQSGTASLSPEADAYEAELRRLLGDDYITPPPVPTRSATTLPTREARSVFESSGPTVVCGAPALCTSDPPRRIGRCGAVGDRMGSVARIAMQCTHESKTA
jgi:hypothetical protein